MARADLARRDLEHLASLLRSRRLAAGLTGAELDRQVHGDTERIVVHPGSRLRRATLPSRLTARRVVVFSTRLVPDWLQTPAYALAAAGPLDLQGQRTVEASLRQRQKRLCNDETEFEFLLCEAAVRTAIGPESLMTEQINHLIRLSARHTFRIIPSNAGLAPPHGFELYDDDACVVLRLAPGSVFLTAESDILPFREMVTSAEREALPQRASRRFLVGLACGGSVSGVPSTGFPRTAHTGE